MQGNDEESYIWSKINCVVIELWWTDQIVMDNQFSNIELF